MDTLIKKRKYKKRDGKYNCYSVRLYRIWYNMCKRCSSKADSVNRPNYYDRGIRVCEEWKHYKIFEKWALSTGYQEYLQIDRIDNEGNYEPTNCRWVTIQVNSQKRRSSKHSIDEIKFLKRLLNKGVEAKHIIRIFGYRGSFISKIKKGTQWNNVGVEG